MTTNTRYVNKSHARKAMTILIDKTAVFKIVYEDTGIDGVRIGLEYTDKTGRERTVWPMDDMLVDVVRTSV